MRVLEFCFDYISPYAYLSWTQHRSLAERYDVQVVPRPVLFAGFLGAHGTIGPAEIPAKRDYMLRDVMRKAHLLGVDIEMPPAHPFNPLLALRATCAVEDVAQQRAVVSALFSAAWREQRALDEADTVRQALASAGLDAAALLEAAGHEAVKARLRQNTESSVAQGVFGVPTWVVDGQLFWGLDSHPLLEAYLGGVEAVDADKLQRWLARPASAARIRPRT